MDIAAIVSVCSMSVHNWVKRYQHGGISSLLTKPGQGRKKILKVEEDAPLITQSLKEHRQSLKAAKALYEAKGGKVVSEESFRLFLKALATPIKGSESRWQNSQTKNFMNTK
jgi:transposase